MSEILFQSLENRILDHLKSWINPLSFTKLHQALNANEDYKKISKKFLLKTLQQMKYNKLIRHSWGPQGWTDVRRKK